MFTGIIDSRGIVTTTESTNGDLVLSISAPDTNLDDMEIGDSIAVSGVCLTAIALGDNEFTADVSAETLALTTLGTWREGDTVNLETALKAGDALGGHLVSGHVDDRAMLVSRTRDARCERYRFKVSKQLSRYIARKGSVCVDGVSLTVNDVDHQHFEVNLIPQTLEHTTLGKLGSGDWVNIEVDILARYVERIVSVDAELS